MKKTFLIGCAALGFVVWFSYRQMQSHKGLPLKAGAYLPKGCRCIMLDATQSDAILRESVEEAIRLKVISPPQK